MPSEVQDADGCSMTTSLKGKPAPPLSALVTGPPGVLVYSTLKAENPTFGSMVVSKLNIMTVPEKIVPGNPCARVVVLHPSQAAPL